MGSLFCGLRPAILLVLVVSTQALVVASVTLRHVVPRTNLPRLTAADQEEAQIRNGLKGKRIGKADARTASFEDAQVIGARLASILAESCAAGEPMSAEAVEVLRALVSTSEGARGWFVQLLTDPAYAAVFRPPIDAQLLTAIEASPDPNLKLLTMNVAMSTATELVHVANGSDELAAASRLTRERSKILLDALMPRMVGLVEEVRSLRSAVEPYVRDDQPADGANEEWVRFTRKWGYGAEQRAAIKAELDVLLKRYDEPPPLGGVPPELIAVLAYGVYAVATGQVDLVAPPTAIPGP